MSFSAFQTIAEAARFRSLDRGVWAG